MTPTLLALLVILLLVLAFGGVPVNGRGIVGVVVAVLIVVIILRLLGVL